jgi:trimeric autotransporter adhesin
MFKRISDVKRAVFALAIFSLTTALLPAQSYYGGLRGTIQDQNGGVITSAKVILINEGTSEQRAIVSTQAGEFVFSELVPATYAVVVESPGFKKFERKGIIVGTQQQVSVDLKLEVGQVTESVEVTESAPLVESANASQGQVLDNQQLTELPNLGRNPFMLSKLVENVMPVGNPAYNRMEDQSGSSSISIAGGPVRGNNYLIDGVPITDSANRAIIIPTLEAVQEVKVQANTYDAEMARTGGGMFNTLMRSGANEYHGSLYGHLRRTSWDANSFFSNASGEPITNQPNDTWGASFGGKVWIPKLYDGKNKTFFFLGYEHYDDIQSSSNTYATPSLLERAGDFSQTRNPDGSPLTIYDPQTTVNGVRQPFAGNKIPLDRLSPVGLAIANSFQAPTSTAAFFGDNNLAAPGQLPCRAAQYTGKLDEDFTKWWRGSLSYLRYFSLEPGNTEFPTASSPNQWRLQRRVDATQLNNLFTLNPTTVLTVRYGFNRFPNYSYNASQGFDLATLGFSPDYVSQVPKALSQFPIITTNNFYQTGASDNNSFYVLSSKNFSADISKYLGRHSIKAGFDYRKISAAGADSNNAAGEFDFNGKFTASKGQTGLGGADLADLLLGYPSDGFQYTATKLTEFINYYGAFIQDDFRVSQKLTVNLGLRWEREIGLQEEHDGLVVGFNGSAINPLGGNGVVQYATPGGKTSAGNPTLNKWGPRAGAAYQLDPKTVLRAGYGIFWAPQFLMGSPIATVGYNQTTEYFATADNFTTPANTLYNPFPNGILQPVGKSLGAATGIGSSFSLIDPAAKSPYVQQFSFDIQRELPFGIATEVGYVGSRSKHLVLGAASVNGNALNPALLSTVAGLPSTSTNPYFTPGGTGFIGSPTVSTYQLYLPFPTFGAINKSFSDFNKAKYDSMVLKAQKRFSHGLTFLTTLTWSRNWDASGGGVANTLNGGNKGPQDPYNLNGEYAFSNIDSPWRWATSLSYELPFGQGKRFVNQGGVTNWIVGGWSFNTVSIFQTGFPLQISQTNNNSGLGYASQRPNATGVSPVTSGSLEQRLNDYINPAAFSTAPQYTFGNVGRTIDMRGPGQVNWDMSLFKTVTFKERVKAQYRLEALNAMNTPFFYGPNVNFSSGSFGKITSQANFSRQLQMAVRLSF